MMANIFVHKSGAKPLAGITGTELLEFLHMLPDFGYGYLRRSDGVIASFETLSSVHYYFVPTGQ